MSVMPPLPCIFVASMKRRSPPAAVQARPVATPGVSVRSAVSIQNFSGPRMISRSSGVMVRLVPEPFATSTATARQTSAMVRSRLRTPASRVKPVMSFERAGSVSSMLSIESPCSFTCFGMR